MSSPELNNSPVQYKLLCEDKKKTSWLVDDSCVFRMKNQDNLIDTVSTIKPLNGALFAFNPGTGKLIMSVLPKSWFSRPHDLSRMIKEKTLEAMTDLLEHINASEHPKEIIMEDPELVKAVGVRMVYKYPHIKVKPALFNIPFPSLLKLDKIAKEIEKPITESQVIQFNLFDNWLKGHGSYIASCNMLSIAQGLHADQHNVMNLKSRDGLAGGYPPYWIIPWYLLHTYLSFVYLKKDINW